jgi:hypothetical protein
MKGAGKSTPNLPMSSRMQMPTGGGKAMPKVKTGESKGTTKKVMATASKGKTMAKKGY